MADLKISELTNLTAADPVSDMLPIVDVSATPPASGSTKRISINNLLSSSPTASGALTVTGLVTAGSATITGNLLVGTTNNFPTSRLCVQGTAGTGTPDVTIGIPLNASSNTNLAIGRSASTGGYIYLDAYKAAVGGTELVLNHLNNGTVLIGTSTVVAAGGCLQLRSGITFPATQVASSDANTLDDYEEGTWTIGLKFGGASVGLTTSANTGRYTKVGRQVSVSGTVQLLNKGSSTGSATITGLPFGVGTNNEAYAAANLRLSAISYTGAFQAFVANATPVIYIEQISILGAVTDLTDSNYTNSSSMMFNLTYTV